MPAACPFVKPTRVADVAPLPADPDCKHEWRQHWTTANLPSGFYCVFCLTITTSRI